MPPSCPIWLTFYQTRGAKSRFKAGRPRASGLSIQGYYATLGAMWKWIVVAALLIVCLGCGYGFVMLQDTLPGGVKRVAIPTFNNRTHEAGLENVFTQAIRNEFFKSKIVEVVAKEEAQAEIIGTINSIGIQSMAHSERDLSGRAKKILANQYSANVDVSVVLSRIPDKKILWERNLSDARQYITTEELLKNEVKQQEAFQKIALYLMEQAHDIMLEDF